MFCHQCGKQLPIGANFCSNCGEKVNANIFTAPAGSTMFRPQANRMIAGVCAAITQRYGWDLTATRILAVLLGIFVFPLGEIAYLVAWLLIPEEAPLAPFTGYTPPPPPPA
jgi:phage shock protein C